MAKKDVISFKKKYKYPCCTKAPWENCISPEVKNKRLVLLDIRQESIDHYGCSLSECPNRKICIGKKCIGRPLPWKCPSAKPLLEALKETARIENGDLFIETDCSSCPMYKDCTGICGQIKDYLSRDCNLEELSFENYSPIENMNYYEIQEYYENTLFAGLEIPWDCISEKKQQVVKMYLYEQKDFLHIAKQLELYNQASSKYEFYTALTRLSKVGTIRKFLKDHWDSFGEYHKSLLEEAFINNKSYVQIAKERNITPQGVQQVITRILKKNKVKWQIYIYRKRGKLYYNVPAILK